MKREMRQEIKKMPFFSLESSRPQSKENIRPFLKYQINKGRILRIKRGIYVFEEFVEKEKNKGNFESYLEFLANKIIQPSYLSLEYVLGKYSLISEAIYGLTSITLKTPRQINNNLGIFSYRKIKDSLFCGYQVVKKGKYVILEASKAKALFDFLYFQKRGLEKIELSFINELRLNLEEMRKSDWQEFNMYVRISKSKKMRIILSIFSNY